MTSERYDKTAIDGGIKNSNGLDLMATYDYVDVNFNHYANRLRAITFVFLRENSNQTAMRQFE